MVQMEDVESEAEQQPFGGDLRTATKQKTPEIKILLSRMQSCLRPE